ncbi:hypothetical protein HMPREF1420_01079 [Helicobacter pylori GAM264Ai]|nr:hypothetical protein HMPREF1420_01079 [Helicobacter pylori GAM264Ai]
MQNLFISLGKSFLQQTSNNQISFFRRNPFDNQTKQPKLKPPFFITTPIQTTSFLLK